eukprot:tig00000692_g3262.t1
MLSEPPQPAPPYVGLPYTAPHGATPPQLRQGKRDPAREDARKKRKEEERYASELKKVQQSINASKRVLDDLGRCQEVQASIGAIQEWIRQRQQVKQPIIDVRLLWGAISRNPGLAARSREVERVGNRLFDSRDGRWLLDTLNNIMGWPDDSSALDHASFALDHLWATDWGHLLFSASTSFMNAMKSDKDRAATLQEVDDELKAFFHTELGRRSLLSGNNVMGSLISACRTLLLRAVAAVDRVPFDASATLRHEDVIRVGKAVSLSTDEAINVVSQVFSSDMLIQVIRKIVVPPISGRSASPLGPAEFSVKNVHLSSLSFSAADVRFERRGDALHLSNMSLLANFNDIAWSVAFEEHDAFSTNGLLDAEFNFTPISSLPHNAPSRARHARSPRASLDRPPARTSPSPSRSYSVARRSSRRSPLTSTTSRSPTSI